MLVFKGQFLIVPFVPLFLGSTLRGPIDESTSAAHPELRRVPDMAERLPFADGWRFCDSVAWRHDVCLWVSPGLLTQYGSI